MFAAAKAKAQGICEALDDLGPVFAVEPWKGCLSSDTTILCVMGRLGEPLGDGRFFYEYKRKVFGVLPS